MAKQKGKKEQGKGTKEKPGNEVAAYEVGYKKPPVHTRFTSENQPDNRGRKPGSTTFKKEAMKLLRGMSDAMNEELSPMGILARQLIALCVSTKVNGQEVSPSTKLAALREILDRLEGKPLQSLSINDEQAIELPLEWIIPIEVLENEQTERKAEGGH